MAKTKVYLASPYTVTGKVETKDKLTRLQERYELVTRVIADLTLKYHDTHVFFGPITHSHPVSLHLPMETNTYEFWLEGIDMEWLPVMDEVWVLTDTDWNKSRGVATEMWYAIDKGLPLKFVDPKTLTVLEKGK